MLISKSKITDVEDGSEEDASCRKVQAVHCDIFRQREISNLKLVVL